MSWIKFSALVPTFLILNSLLSSLLTPTDGRKNLICAASTIHLSCQCKPNSISFLISFLTRLLIIPLQYIKDLQLLSRYQRRLLSVGWARQSRLFHDPCSLWQAIKLPKYPNVLTCSILSRLIALNINLSEGLRNISAHAGILQLGVSSLLPNTQAGKVSPAVCRRLLIQYDQSICTHHKY